MAYILSKKKFWRFFFKIRFFGHFWKKNIFFVDFSLLDIVLLVCMKKLESITPKYVFSWHSGNGYAVGNRVNPLNESIETRDQLPTISHSIAWSPPPSQWWRLHGSPSPSSSFQPPPTCLQSTEGPGYTHIHGIHLKGNIIPNLYHAGVLFQVEGDPTWSNYFDI